MEVFINRIKDEVLVKHEGIVTVATVIKRKPSNDPVAPINEAQVAYDSALENLKKVIVDVKQKAELYSLGIENQTNFDLKVVEYSNAKAAYETAKSNL